MNLSELQGAGPWPLDYTEKESPVPNGILLDISLAGPVNTSVVLDTLSWGGPIWGVCLCASDRVPLAWYWSIEEPEIGMPLPLETVSGWRGTVMFGRYPEKISLLDLNKKLDPRCLTFIPSDSRVGTILGYILQGYIDEDYFVTETSDVPTIIVDGVEYPTPPGGVLTIRGTGYLTSSIEGGKVVLRRSDALLDVESRWRLFQSNLGTSLEAGSIGGSTPDVNGNIDIIIDPGGTSRVVKENPPGKKKIPIGIVLTSADFEKCADADLEEYIKCRTEMGIPQPLPLDYVRCPGLNISVCNI